MSVFSTQRLYVPTSEEQRFLPEGPYPCGPHQFSWVAIQHGPGATHGALNIYDWKQHTNQQFNLPERPGFAFPTNRDGVFVVGAGHEVALFNTRDNSWKPFATGVDAGLNENIINDGVVIEEGLIFGCKHCRFAEAIAGLYLWRRRDQQLIPLRRDQTCSNGKVILQDGLHVSMLDIDTKTHQVVRREIDINAGREVAEPQVVLDFGDEFPDGMIATPDGMGVIIAFFKPGNPAFGEARQYSIEGHPHRAPVAIWTVERSSRVTCPQLIRTAAGVKLILTTADEGMPAEVRAKHSDAGCLFIGDTRFNDVPSTPVFNADGL